MERRKILGVAFVTLGIFLLAFAYHAANTPHDQIAGAITNRFIDDAALYLMLGIATIATGGYLMLKAGTRRRRRHRTPTPLSRATAHTPDRTSNLSGR